LTGRLYTAATSAGDSFYRPLASVDPAGTIAVDPVNGIAKRLHSAADEQHDAASLGHVVATTTASPPSRIDPPHPARDNLPGRHG
jgi:hypothetical protein